MLTSTLHRVATMKRIRVNQILAQRRRDMAPMVTSLSVIAARVADADIKARDAVKAATSDLSALTVPALMEMARAKDIKGRSKMTKAALVAALSA